MSRYGAMANAIIREPADNALEEVYRAIVEIRACVQLFVRRSEDQLELLTGRPGGVQPDAWNDPGPPDRVMTHQDVRDGMRRIYGWFETAVPRAIVAITRLDWTPTGTSTEPVLSAISDIRALFPPPLVLLPEHEPGDHLLEGNSPLAMSVNGKLNLERHRAEIASLVATLQRFENRVSDLLIAGINLRMSSLETGPHPRPLEETFWTKTSLAGAIKVHPTTILRWGSRFSWYSELGKNDYLRRGQVEALADAASAMGNVEKAGRLRALARS